MTIEQIIQSKIGILPEQKQAEVLNFLNVLIASQTKIDDREVSNGQQDQDFFELAGIWENKDITSESLRIKAWSREKP